MYIAKNEFSNNDIISSRRDLLLNDKFCSYIEKKGNQLYYKVILGNQQFSSKKMANFFEPVKVLNVFWSWWKCLEDSIKEIIYKLIALISRISLVLVRGKSVKFLKPLGPLVCRLGCPR